jgi:hypothetical protein
VLAKHSEERRVRARRNREQVAEVIAIREARQALARARAAVASSMPEGVGQVLALEVERTRVEAERREAARLAAMSSLQLADEIRRLRPRPVAELIPQHPEVVAARQAVQAAELAVREARESSAQAEEWRRSHSWRAQFMRLGIARSDQVARWDALAAELPDREDRHAIALDEERHTIESVRMRLEIEQTPVLTMIDELEQMRVKRLSEERSRVLLQERIAETLQAVEEAARGHLLGGRDWQNTKRLWGTAVTTLQPRIDAYIEADDEGRRLLLEEMEQEMREDPARIDRLRGALGLPGEEADWGQAATPD